MRAYTRVLAVLFLTSLSARAQNTDIQSLQGLQFDFSNPGARALAMGGAFLGLADDASAAEANPAGLTILRKPEISIEARRLREDQLLPTSGTYPDIVRTSFPSKVGSVSFASIVAPIGTHFTAGVYYHEPLRDKASGVVLPTYNRFTGELETQPPDFYIVDGTDKPVSAEQCLAIADPSKCFHVTVAPFLTDVRVLEQTFGVAGAWNFGKLSVGASVRFQRFTEEAVNGILGDAGQNLYLSSIAIQQSGSGHERDTTFTAGMKWTPIERLSIGAVYKEGARYAAPTTLSDPSTKNAQTIAVNFHVPDVYGAGVAYRPIDPLTFTTDVVRVKYSNLTDDFVSINDLPGNGFKANDALEVRIGSEYFLPLSIKTPVALRAGVWHDPAHAIVWTNPKNSNVDPIESIFTSIYFPQGEDQTHYSVGLGISWTRFQLDAGYDTSPHRKIGSISAIARF